MLHIKLETAIENLGALEAAMFGSNIKYVLLETTDLSLIGALPVIRKYKNRLIICSENMPIKIFDATNGKYICQVGLQDKGPQGSLSLSSCMINSFTDEIYINAPDNNHYRVWDMNGNFVRTAKFPEIKSDALSLNQNIEVFAPNTLIAITGGDYFFYRENDSVVTKRVGSAIFSQVTIGDVSDLVFYNKQATNSSSPSLLWVVLFNLHQNHNLQIHYMRLKKQYGIMTTNYTLRVWLQILHLPYL